MKHRNYSQEQKNFGDPISAMLYVAFYVDDLNSKFFGFKTKKALYVHLETVTGIKASSHSMAVCECKSVMDGKSWGKAQDYWSDMVYRYGNLKPAEMAQILKFILKK